MRSHVGVFMPAYLRNIQANPTMATSLENLRAFTSKHRPTLAEYGIRALDLVVDHTRCLRDVLHLVLVHRAEAARIEMSFFLVTVDVVPLESFGGKAEEMREQLQLANEAQRGAGLTGSFGVVLTCMSPSNPAMNITFVGFTKRDLADFTPGMPWKEELTRRLNEGIVV
ncbi:hypothetical protein BOTBODRAFT_38799 [Botryobasidium botryosum FD-172 SS1]|uniref:Uncharacterized protein n=1 Tax=Botryobasidium botryosum (strain FD-172 SS1) TaxID=930990 RepID=A0A067LYP3_BOTB1|nr:hypothetical protein BOTBODRAFT_38799 [Botryobasidium botryosum FD-172 SS1]